MNAELARLIIQCNLSLEQAKQLVATCRQAEAFLARFGSKR